MSDENCNVCGSPLSSLGGEGTALAQHILDHNDPHRTLELVPTIEIGIGAPSSARRATGGPTSTLTSPRSEFTS